jgi:predicted choloylglycine hydrolase
MPIMVSSGRDFMYQVRVKGTYYEMGYVQGEMLEKGVLPPIWSESLNETVGPKRAKFADECEKIVRRYMPDFLNELQGIADATGADYHKVKTWPLCSYGGLSPQSCSAVAISGKHTEDGKPLFIRNYDYLDSDREYFTAFWTKPENGYASLGFSDAMSSRYCGVNEKGLAIGSSISGYAGPPQPGVAFSLVTRWVLDHFSATDEATEFLTEVPHFHGWNFLLCDMQNNIVRVETCPKKVAVVHFDEGIGVSSNHYFSQEMKTLEEKNWLSEGSTVKRYENALNWFRNRDGPIAIDYACKLASSHVDEGGLCDKFVGVEGGTLWSWIYTIDNADILICEGPPCKNSYRKIRAL